MLSDIFSVGSYFLKHDIARYIMSGVPFGFDDRMFYIMEREVPLYLCKHRGFRLDIGGVEVFTKVQESAWQGNFASLEASAIWQASDIDLEHPVRFGGVSNTC